MLEEPSEHRHRKPRNFCFLSRGHLQRPHWLERLAGDADLLSAVSAPSLLPQIDGKVFKMVFKHFRSVMKRDKRTSARAVAGNSDGLENSGFGYANI